MVLGAVKVDYATLYLKISASGYTVAVKYILLLLFFQ